MARDMNEIISQIQDVIMTLEYEHNEMMKDKTDEEKSRIKEKSSGYFKHIKDFEKEKTMRDQQLKDFENKYRDLSKIAAREITKRDNFIKELLNRLPQEQTDSLKKKFESSTETDKDTSWWGILGKITTPFTSKSHSNPPEAYKLDMSRDGSSGKHEAGADLGSSIDHEIPDLKFTTSDIDIIPMTKTELNTIPGNTTSKTSFRENFVNVLLNLDRENLKLLKKKYNITSSDSKTAFKIIKLLGFEVSLLDDLGADHYRHLREAQNFTFLPEWPKSKKPSRTDFAKCLSGMKADLRSQVLSHLADLTLLKYGSETDFPVAFKQFHDLAGQYGIDLPDDKITQYDQFDNFFTEYLDEEYEDKLKFP